MAAAVLASAVLYGASAFAYQPAINYVLHCMGCHGPDGSGEHGHVPSIRGSLSVFAATPAGRRFLVQVPGSAQSQLADAELAAVLNWMIETLSARRRDHFIPFTASEVSRYRRTPRVDVRAERERLLGRVPD